MSNINPPVPILASGKGWIVVDKPCGISIHNQPGADLLSILKLHIENNPLFQQRIHYEPGDSLHAVHRLDIETSGIILLACHQDVFRFFSKQFETRTIKKRYIALLHGNIPEPEIKNSWNNWDYPLSKKAGGRKDPKGNGPFVECRTRFRIIKYSKHYSLLECEPVTGRKHQIRRHAKLCGHPVTGDERYGSSRALKFLIEKAGFSRLGLHSFSITLKLPEQEKLTTIQTEKIPSEIQQLLNNDICSV